MDIAINLLFLVTIAIILIISLFELSEKIKTKRLAKAKRKIDKEFEEMIDAVAMGLALTIASDVVKNIDKEKETAKAKKTTKTNTTKTKETKSKSKED